MAAGLDKVEYCTVRAVLVENQWACCKLILNWVTSTTAILILNIVHDPVL